MTEAELRATIDQYYCPVTGYASPPADVLRSVWNSVPDVLSAMDDSRKRVAALEAMVDELLDCWPGAVIDCCRSWFLWQKEHRPGCPVVRARALLEAKP